MFSRLWQRFMAPRFYPAPFPDLDEHQQTMTGFRLLENTERQEILSELRTKVSLIQGHSVKTFDAGLFNLCADLKDVIDVLAAIDTEFPDAATHRSFRPKGK